MLAGARVSARLASLVVGELSGHCRGIVGELSGNRRGLVGESSGNRRGIVGVSVHELSKTSGKCPGSFGELESFK